MTTNANSDPRKTFLYDKRLLIDIFKGLAVSQVILFHSIFSFSSLSQKNGANIISSTISLAEYFKFGPFIFFVISGFLMSTLYGSNLLRLESKTSGLIVRDFYVKRFARIYPLWIIFLFLSYIFFKLFNYGYFSLTMSYLKSTNELYLLTIGATFIYYFISAAAAGWLVPGGWSIVAEIIFYITFPTLRRMTINSLLFISTTLITLCYVLKYLAYHNFVIIEKTSLIYAIIYGGLESTIPFFLLGIIIGEVVRYRPKLMTVFNNKLFLFNITLMLFCLILIDNSSGPNSKTITMIITTYFLGCLISKNRYTSNFFSLMGSKCYFIYFIHFYLIDLFASITDQFKPIFINNFLTNTLLIVIFQIFTVIVSLVLALLSSKFIENPLQKFILRKFIN